MENSVGSAVKRWVIRGVLFVIFVPLICLTLWTIFNLKFSYSTGDRAGYTQKISKKGWLVKTWEGELAMANLPGTMPQIFSFTVRDEKVAQQISESMGRRVAIVYEQHRFLPGTLFGETEYFVTAVQQIEDPAVLPAK